MECMNVIKGKNFTNGTPINNYQFKKGRCYLFYPVSHLY